MQDSTPPTAARPWTALPFVFVGVLGLITIADIADHLTRDTGMFRDLGWRWPAFSLASYAAVSACFLAVERFVRGRLDGLGWPASLSTLLAGDAGIVAAFALHVVATGPLLDRLLVGGEPMAFRFAPVVLFIGAVLYLVLMGITAGVRALQTRPVAPELGA